MTSEGGTVGAVLVFQDVTTSRVLQRELAHSAMHDVLTALPNRAAFSRALEQAIASARAELRQHALCFLDLDHFKTVNDTAGHSAGDKLLQDVANVIRGGCRANDFAARIGGDEFALVLADCLVMDAKTVAEKIVHDIAAMRFTWHGKTFQISASVGVTPISERSPRQGRLMNEADAACYGAKARGRNQVVLYDGTLDAA